METLVIKMVDKLPKRMELEEPSFVSGFGLRKDDVIYQQTRELLSKSYYGLDDESIDTDDYVDEL